MSSSELPKGLSLLDPQDFALLEAGRQLESTLLHRRQVEALALLQRVIVDRGDSPIVYPMRGDPYCWFCHAIQDTTVDFENHAQACDWLLARTLVKWNA